MVVESTYPMEQPGILYDLTGSEKSKLAAPKTEDLEELEDLI